MTDGDEPRGYNLTTSTLLKLTRTPVRTHNERGRGAVRKRKKEVDPSNNATSEIRVLVCAGQWSPPGKGELDDVIQFNKTIA